MKKLLFVVALVVLWAQSAQSLTIIRDFTGGPCPTNTVGGGNLTNIFDAACRVWEMAIRDDAVVTLHYGWVAMSDIAIHTLNAQGGSPNREIEGTISFDGDPWFTWLLDENLLDNQSYAFTQESVSLGGGTINASRHFALTNASPVIDLFTLALHEIGHALGMSVANTTFIAQGADGYITLSNGPYAGTVVPLDHNNYGVTSHIQEMVAGILMSGKFNWNQRVVPSALDIATMAQLSEFRDLNLDLAPVLTMGAPYSSERSMKVDLTWIQPLPPPPGTQYRVQMCTDIASGDWQTVPDTAAVNNGVHSQTVGVCGNAFFRLKAE